MKACGEPHRRIYRAERKAINQAAWNLYGPDFLGGRHSMIKAFAQSSAELDVIDFVRDWERRQVRRSTFRQPPFGGQPTSLRPRPFR